MVQQRSPLLSQPPIQPRLYVECLTSGNIEVLNIYYFYEWQCQVQAKVATMFLSYLFWLHFGAHHRPHRLWGVISNLSVFELEGINYKQSNKDLRNGPRLSFF